MLFFFIVLKFILDKLNFFLSTPQLLGDSSREPSPQAVQLLFRNSQFRVHRPLQPLSAKCTPVVICLLCFPGGSDGKESASNAGDLGLITGLGRFCGEGNDYPLQYSFLGNPTDRGAWQASVHGVAKSDTTERLTLWFFHYVALFISPRYSRFTLLDSHFKVSMQHGKWHASNINSCVGWKSLLAINFCFKVAFNVSVDPSSIEIKQSAQNPIPNLN